MKEKQAEKWETQILNLMRQATYRPMKQHELAKALGASSGQRNKLRNVLRQLTDQGAIEKLRQNRYGLPDQPRVLEGTISLHAKGFGFVSVDEKDVDDVFIPPHKTSGARSRDRVRIKVVRARAGRRSRPGAPAKERSSSKNKPAEDLLEGEVIEVVERGLSKVAGILKKRGDSWRLFPNDPRFPDQITVVEFPAGLKPRAGFLGLVELIEDDIVDFESITIKGRLTELGDRAGTPGADMWMLIRNFGLPLSFPDAVEKEAQNLPDAFTDEQSANRTDCRELFTITIDPVTARDFDDALSLQQNKGGHFTLYVHIADVAAFVGQDSAIEAEAVKRAFSVYLPDRVIPMLPERLTTDLCSLVPGQDRLAHTVEIELGPGGGVKGHRSYRSIIHSDVRLTYEQAQEIIDGSEAVEGDRREVALVQKLFRLTQHIRKKRMKHGALDIMAPERKCVYNDEGQITGIEIRRPLPAYQLVEECMLLANQAVAIDLHREYEEAMYRVHEAPNESQWLKMGQDLADIGIETAPQSREDISRLISRLKPESLRSVALITILKNIKRAEYNPEVGEHFGLAFSHYSHFTSPIRRYPDLVVHRLLNHLEQGKKRPFTKNSLAEWARSSSVRERTAEEAERAAVHLKCLQFFEQEMLQGRTGPHQALVTGLNTAGLTVELTAYLQRAFVPFNQPQAGAFYQYKARNGCAETPDGKKRLRVGDRVTTEISVVSLEERRMEVQLCNAPKSKRPAKPTEHHKGKKKSGKHK